MNNVGGLVFGMLAGAIGAAAWAVLVFYGNVQSGWLAWGIGAFVGFAVSYGTKQAGFLPATIAVIITIASICAGKYTAISLDLNRSSAGVNLSEADCIANLGMRLAEQSIAGGETIPWKNGKNYQTVEDINDFPDELQQESRQTWSAMTTEEKAAFKKDAEQQIRDAICNFAPQAFMNSFALFDLIFFGLGIVTAGRIAYTDVIDGQTFSEGRDEETE